MNRLKFRINYTLTRLKYVVGHHCVSYVASKLRRVTPVIWGWFIPLLLYLVFGIMLYTVYAYFAKWVVLPTIQFH